MVNKILGLLFALALPLLLVVVEKVLPYPHWVEEFGKLMVVMVMMKSGDDDLGWWVVGGGFLFALSESVFYLSNIFALGDFGMFSNRLMLTSLLHIGTMLVIYLLGKKSGKGLGFGFLIAVGVHYVFNVVM